MPLNIPVTVTVPIQFIHNAIIGALEGGSAYWLHQADIDEGYMMPESRLVWWGYQEVFEQPFKFTVVFEDPKKADGNKDGRRQVENDDIGRALTIMATKFPKHFADLMSEQDDATTHDVFMQCLVLDDVVFG